MNQIDYHGAILPSTPFCTMKILSSDLFKLFVILLSVFASPQATLAQGKTISYEVQRGETLYQIAKRYGTTVTDIVNANSGLQADSVKAGKSILIPVNAAPSEASSPSRSSDSEERTHIVKRKETVYGIAKAYQISVEELYAANPEIKATDNKLKKGMVLRIPSKTPPQTTVSLSKQSLRVCVLLPFQGNGIENTRSVEFYRGFLMGVEKLKEQNISVSIHAYQEPAQDESVALLMQQITDLHPDLIIGPVYPSHFGDVTARASSSCKVAIPFSSKVPQVEYRPNVFVINTPQRFERTLCANLLTASFSKEYKIIVLSDTHGERKELVDFFKTNLTEKKYAIKTIDAKSSTEDLLRTLGKNAKGNYLFIPEFSNEKSLKEFLPKLRDLRNQNPQAHISLLGYEEWLPWAASDLRDELHAADTYILTPSYFYPYTTASIAFRDDYRKWFKTDLQQTSTPRMAPLGYDLCLALLGGIAAYGENFNTQTAQLPSLAALPKLQSDLRFMAAATNGGYVSRSYWLVHFKADMSIVKLSAQ